ncbi:MAG: serine--tRNA ligase [Firmicutes bacterium]|nr:serine--tRNA ligase [Bacillota bacterium]
MLDINRIFTEKTALANGLAKKGYDVSRLDHLETLVVKSRNLNKQIEELRAHRNKIQSDKNISVDEKRAVRDQIAGLDTALLPLQSEIDALLYDIPNTPDEDAPVGNSEADNKVIFETTDFYVCKTDKPKPHWEVAKSLDILDTELASKVSGSMFAFYRGKGAQLLRALISYALKINGKKYTEVIPPHMVSSQTLTYTGHLPKFAAEQYKAQLDDLWLIPTAEVPLTAGFAQTVYDLKELPKRVMGYSVCFRREAGSAGKDTRGLQRLHEFHKVELVKIVEPSACKAELADLLEDCLKPIKDLKLRYRIVDLCTGDMGDKYGRCYDIEVYSPGVQKWLEVSSVGHFSDYQARRAGIRYKNADGKKGVAFTLNGSGLATPRVWTAIIETYQQPDGSVIVPDVLKPYMDCDKID